MAVRGGETPNISSTNYSNATYSAGAIGTPLHVLDSDVSSGWKMPEDEKRIGIGAQHIWHDPSAALRGRKDDEELMRRVQAAVMPKQQQPKKEEVMPGARIVKVYIADPDEALDLEQRVLYKGDEKLTDLSDQELYFDINVGELLKEHNERRVKVLDKKATARANKDVFLEPIRVRDLKMVVVTIAQF